MSNNVEQIRRLNAWATAPEDDPDCYRVSDRALAITALIFGAVNALGGALPGCFATDYGGMEMENCDLKTLETGKYEVTSTSGLNIMSGPPDKPVGTPTTENDPAFWVSLYFENITYDAVFDDIVSAVCVAHLVENDSTTLTELLSAVEGSANTVSMDNPTPVAAPENLIVTSLAQRLDKDALARTYQQVRETMPVATTSDDDAARIQMIQTYLKLGAASVS